MCLSCLLLTQQQYRDGGNSPAAQRSKDHDAANLIFQHRPETERTRLVGRFREVAGGLITGFFVRHVVCVSVVALPELVD